MLQMMKTKVNRTNLTVQYNHVLCNSDTAYITQL